MDILSYHQRSKHRPDAYARGPESIDWDAQPDPFRTFEAPDDAGRSARHQRNVRCLVADEGHARD